MEADDFRLLSAQFNEGNRFLVISTGAAQLVQTRAEAANLLNDQVGIAFEVRALTSGNYQSPAAASMEATYRKVGIPYFHVTN